MEETILVVDDNEDTRLNIVELLEENGYRTLAAENGQTALEIIKQQNPDCVVLDMYLPVLSGWDVLDQIKPEIDNGMLVIIITAFGDIPRAVDAVKKGAFDFFDKPFNNEKLLLAIRHGLDRNQLQRELREYKTVRITADDFGPSSIIRKVLQDAEKVAPTDLSVLIQGPTGCGKNLLAKYIHEKSNRRLNPLINLDCGSISSNLIESELFGHIKGSFTGALEDKIGKFRAAHSGTLVLDEVGNIPLTQQSKFLRVVEEKKIAPIGSDEEYQVDFRLIVATLEDLEKSVNQGTFRRDLFFRLTEFVIVMPPLAERQEDIPHLTKKFLNRSNLTLNKSVYGISDGAMNKLLGYRWPGNVRELQHVVSTAVLNARDVIQPEQIILRGAAIDSNTFPQNFPIELQPGTPLRENFVSITAAIEKSYILKALEIAQNNITKAAEIFGTDRKNFYKKLAKYGIKV